MTVRIKICGITASDDALAAVDAGADALGFIFVENTPRYVTPDRVAAIVAALPPFVTTVGVFWDHAPEHVRRVAELCRLHALQLHGQEPPEVVAGFDLPVLKTIKVAGPADLEPLDRYKPAAFLLDSPARWSEGAPRAPISWTLAREAGRRARVVLSAGLTPETVGAAIQVARPFGVDVNSGVEASPGRKDLEKVRRFVRAARAAAAELLDHG
jgi:phosphoribosylanthranilate isomerase